MHKKNCDELNIFYFHRIFLDKKIEFYIEYKQSGECV